VRFCFSDSVNVSKQPSLRCVCLPKVVKDTIVADDDYKVTKTGLIRGRVPVWSGVSSMAIDSFIS